MSEMKHLTNGLVVNGLWLNDAAYSRSHTLHIEETATPALFGYGYYCNSHDDVHREMVENRDPVKISNWNDGTRI